MIPEFWMQFVQKNGFVESNFEIPEEFDLTGFGASMKLLSKEGIEIESNNAYPGIAVKQFGFIPVASCLEGSGDPYFINSKDGENGKLYRVYHDAGTEEDFDLESGVDIILDSYQDLLKYR